MTNNQLEDNEPPKTVAFVILHYKLEELTSACINSILDLKIPDMYQTAVVVVDNYSNNGSLEALSGKYGDNSKVHFICNEANYGFSKANNLGFDYAVKEFDCCFVVILNNDTVIRQHDFLETLITLNTEKYFLIGPDIYVERKKMHQSPVSPLPDAMSFQAKRVMAGLEQPPTTKKIKSFVRRMIYKSSYLKKWLEERAISKSYSTGHWELETDKHQILHGAALIFTNSFIKENQPPFYPETFLYEEEPLLAIRFASNKWTCLYTPRLQVIHHDDGATDYVFPDAKKKNDFLLANEKKSVAILENYASAKGFDIGR